MVWSLEAEAAVRRLMAEPPADPWVREQCQRLEAAFAGWDMWSSFFLRPDGNVVIVGEDVDHPKESSVYNDREHQLMVLVWLSRNRPDFKAILPAREPDAMDCRCVSIPRFAPGQLICSECGGLGWLPAPKSP